MNEIITIEDTTFDVDQIQTMEDIKTFMLKLDTLKKLLEATNKWHENICRYCALEAQAYYKIARLNLHEIGIRHNSIKYKTIKWLETLTDEEIEGYVSRCYEDGISITAIYKEQVIQAENYEWAMSSFEDSTNEILKEIEKTGIVNLESYDKYYFNDMKEILGNDIVNNHIDGIRNKLRQRGAYGIGDGKGTYVDKSHAAEYMNEILKTRMDSIASDVRKIQDLRNQMEKDSIPLPICLVERQPRSLSLTDSSAINILLSLLHVIKLDFRDDAPDYKTKTIQTILLELGIYEDAKELYK